MYKEKNKNNNKKEFLTFFINKLKRNYLIRTKKLYNKYKRVNSKCKLDSCNNNK